MYIANNLNILETKGWVYPSTAREAIRQYQHITELQKKKKDSEHLFYSEAIHVWTECSIQLLVTDQSIESNN